MYFFIQLKFVNIPEQNKNKKKLQKRFFQKTKLLELLLLRYICYVIWGRGVSSNVKARYTM